MKPLLRKRAIDLRRKGYTYSEILSEVPVAKSTLSLWLRSVGLSSRQKHKITKKVLMASQRGGIIRRKQRLKITREIKNKAMSEVGEIDERGLWLMGTMLHWAEGTKNKEYRPSVGVIFSNSDPLMIKIYLKWLGECVKIPDQMIYFDLFVHETSKNQIMDYIGYWAKVTGFPKSKFDKIYLKRNIIKSNRRNKGKKYFGLIRVRVKKSTNLNREIEGWIYGVCKQCGVV